MRFGLRRALGLEQHGPALGRPVAVGSYRANAFGLYNRHGKVGEWCWDAHVPNNVWLFDSRGVTYRSFKRIVPVSMSF